MALGVPLPDGPTFFAAGLLVACVAIAVRDAAERRRSGRYFLDMAAESLAMPRGSSLDAIRLRTQQTTHTRIALQMGLDHLLQVEGGWVARIARSYATLDEQPGIGVIATLHRAWMLPARRVEAIEAKAKAHLVPAAIALEVRVKRPGLYLTAVGLLRGALRLKGARVKGSCR